MTLYVARVPQAHHPLIGAATWPLNTQIRPSGKHVNSPIGLTDSTDIAAIAFLQGFRHLSLVFTVGLRRAIAAKLFDHVALPE